MRSTICASQTAEKVPPYTQGSKQIPAMTARVVIVFTRTFPGWKWGTSDTIRNPRKSMPVKRNIFSSIPMRSSQKSPIAPAGEGSPEKYVFVFCLLIVNRVSRNNTQQAKNIPNSILPVTCHIQSAGCIQKLIKSAISSRYSPAFVLPYFLATFPSSISVTSAAMRSHSAMRMFGLRKTNMHQMMPINIPVVVMIFAR